MAPDDDGNAVGEIHIPASLSKTRRGRIIGLEVSPLLLKLLATIQEANGPSTRVFEHHTLDLVETARKRLISNYGAPPFDCKLAQPVTDVHAQDPLALLRASGKGVQNVPVDEKEGCRECAFRYQCAGGCPQMTYRATGRYDVKSPYCNVYSALYPKLLRLEALRLVKFGANCEGTGNQIARPMSASIST